MGQKHETFREFRTPFPPRDIRKNPRSMRARVPQVMAQFVLQIELLSHIMGTTPILEMARAYGLRPRLWLLPLFEKGARAPLGEERRPDTARERRKSSLHVHSREILSRYP